MNETKFKIGDNIEFSEYSNVKGVRGVVVGFNVKTKQILFDQCDNKGTVTYAVKPKNLKHIIK